MLFFSLLFRFFLLFLFRVLFKSSSFSLPGFFLQCFDLLFKFHLELEALIQLVLQILDGFFVHRVFLFKVLHRIRFLSKLELQILAFCLLVVRMH